LIKFAILKRVIETLQPELAETKETQAHLTAELETTKKQMADMYQIIQSIGQPSGVHVQLPAPAPVRHFIPVSMQVVGLRAVGIVGLCAIVIFGLRAVGIVGLRAVVSCMLETSPCRGGAAEIFNFDSNTCNFFSFVQPTSADSNNPATVSPAADRVNPMPESSPSPQSGGPHLQSPPPQ
jgi:hypothetical protein